MMKQEKLILKYLNNSLTKDEEAKFNKLLKNDLEFKTAFEEYKDLRMAFILKEKDELKQRLNSINSKSIEPSKTLFKNKTLWLAIASCIIIGLFYVLPNKSRNTLYEDYFDKYPNVYAPVVRGVNNFETNAFNAYENGNYVEAERQFKKALKSNPNPNLSFYYAMTLLNQDNIIDAEKILNNLKFEDFEFKPEVYWYLSLISIKKENLIEAKSFLLSLQNTKSTFKKNESTQLMEYIGRVIQEN